MKKLLLSVILILAVSCTANARNITLQDDAYIDKYMAPYVNEVEHIVKANWEKPSNEMSMTASDKTVLVKFNVLQDGKIDGLKIVTPSGDDRLDASVVSAVRAAAPFKPMPKEYYGNSVEIQMTFESKLLKKQYINPEFY